MLITVDKNVVGTPPLFVNLYVSKYQTGPLSYAQSASVSSKNWKGPLARHEKTNVLCY